jgi:ADP-ribose pyrophosphatase
MKKWPTLSTQKILTAHVFRYLKVERQSPLTHKVGEFDVVQCFNWVNVIAITKDQKIVLVKQYRHGTDEITLEIPGGAVHPNEEFLLAAQRELQEETGYTSKEWSFLGQVDANPAFMSNYCQTYLAMNAVKTHDQNLDPFEEIEVELIDVNKLNEMVLNGAITHSLIIAALYFFSSRGQQQSTLG